MVRIIYDYEHFHNGDSTLSNLMKLFDEEDYEKLNQWVEDINYIDINKPSVAGQYQSIESFDNYESDGYFNVTKYKEEDAHNVFSMSFLGDNLHSDDSPNIITLSKLPENLKVLVIRDLNITELPELPDGLMFLYCDSININKITNLPDSLVYLHLDRLDELEINIFPDSLRYLYIDSENLHKLPHFPDTIEYLRLYDYNYNIVKLPKVLIDLSLHNCNNLLDLPKTLKKIYIYNCKIEDFPESILDTELYYNIYKNNGTKYYNGPICIKLTPLGNKIENLNLFMIKLYSYNDWLTNKLKTKEVNVPDIKKYFQYKKAVETISDWFLDCKYNPKYKYCKDRLDNEFKNLYNE